MSHYVRVFPFETLTELTVFHETWYEHFVVGGHIKFPSVSDNSRADARNCGTGQTLAPLNLGSSCNVW
jgi:hypothetical protein